MSERRGEGGATFTRAERRVLARDLAQGAALECPRCLTALAVHPVQPPAAVSYVRHRVMVVCPACQRAASVDVPPDARTG